MKTLTGKQTDLRNMAYYTTNKHSSGLARTMFIPIAIWSTAFSSAAR